MPTFLQILFDFSNRIPVGFIISFGNFYFFKIHLLFWLFEKY